MKCRECGCKQFECNRYGFYCLLCGSSVFSFRGNINKFDYQDLISNIKKPVNKDSVKL